MAKHIHIHVNGKKTKDATESGIQLINTAIAKVNNFKIPGVRDQNDLDHCENELKTLKNIIDKALATIDRHY